MRPGHSPSITSDSGRFSRFSHEGHLFGPTPDGRNASATRWASTNDAFSSRRCGMNRLEKGAFGPGAAGGPRAQLRIRTATWGPDSACGWHSGTLPAVHDPIRFRRV